MNEPYKSFLNNTAKAGGIFSLVMLSASCNENADETKDRLPAKPNILCLTVEDISPMLGCYGDTLAHTPNIDELAAEGVLFTNAFTTAGVCAPSRSALITGMYHSSIGANHMRTSSKIEGQVPYEAVPPAVVKCFTEFLRADGYYCTNNAKTDYQFKTPVTAWDESSTRAHWRNRPEGMPFFSIFNHMTTHESQVWGRANDPVTVPQEWVTVPPYYPDTKMAREDVARVYSNIAVMDREIGDIIAQLKADGLYNNTIIIFYSDHGGPLPRQKREIYDSGLKVPLIIRFPNAQHAGMVVDDLVSFVDIPPTILSIAGISIPAYMQGQAFWGEQKEPAREYIFAARDRMDGQYDMRRAIRDNEYKLIKNFFPEKGAYLDIEFRKNLGMMKELLYLKNQGRLDAHQMQWFRTTKEPIELYDIQKDPHEMENLANNPEYTDVVQRMTADLEAWMKETDDKGMLTEKQLILSMWPGMEQPETEAPSFTLLKNNAIGLHVHTKGASMAYMVNKNTPEPQKRWLLYTEPVTVQPGDTIFSKAIRIGYKPSEEVMLVKR